MNNLNISQLSPELSELGSKQIRGIVTLIWPFSSSARQFALLLGDPDFRLRRRHGQVRVRFSGSSARAVANTGVGIGDEVVLSLRGVEFVRDGLLSTPGKSIDWELAYSQTLRAHIIREGGRLADLDFYDVPPTPAPRSSPRPCHSFESSHQWSSPAYLKRMRLSDIPSLEPAYDAAPDKEHTRKRRRRSYKDWDAWTYVGRTPSPEKEDADTELSNSMQGSPVRAVEMAATPISSARMQMVLDGGISQEPAEQDRGMESDGQTVSRLYSVEVEDSIPSKNNVQISSPEGKSSQEAIDDVPYALPDKQHSGIDNRSLRLASEPNSDRSSVGVDSQKISHDAALSLSNIEDPDISNLGRLSPETIKFLPGYDEAQAKTEFDARTTQETTEVEPAALANDDFDEFLINESADRPSREYTGAYDHSVALAETFNEASDTVMPPPPTLSVLQTDFRTTYRPGMLTPIGKEPASPNLQPLDSSTLPMPSPFPGERDGNISSYLDFVSSPQPRTQQAPVDDTHQVVHDEEADYILETSFYSSVSSSKAPAFHPTHESAFTDVRFTFGLDGAALSRPHTSSGVAETFDVSATNNLGAGEALFGSPIPPNRTRIQSNKIAGDIDSYTPGSPLSREPFPQPAAVGDLALPSSPRHRYTKHLTQHDAEVSAGEHGNVSDQDQMIVEEEHIQGNDVASYQALRVAEEDSSGPGTADLVEHFKPSMSIERLQDDSDVGESVQQYTVGSDSTGANVSFDDSIQDTVPEVFAQTSDLSVVPDNGMDHIIHAASSINKVSITQDVPYADHEMAHTTSSPLDAVWLTSPYDEKESTIEPFQKMYTDPRQTGNGDISGDVDLTLQPPQENTQDESTEGTFSSFVDEEGRQAEDEAMDVTFEATSSREHNVNMHHSTLEPDTSPVRNTRSKAKTSEDLKFVISRDSQTGSTLTPLSGDPQETRSPPATQFTSPASPTSESLLTSDYYMKSPSNLSSPAHSASDRSASRQGRSSPNLTQQQGASAHMSLHTNDTDISQTEIDSSPRLAIPAPRDTFVNEPSSQASEEGNMHTGPPSSAVQYSNDTGVRIDSNDYLVIERQMEEHDYTPRSAGHTTSHEAASPAHEIAPLVKAAGKSDQVKAVVPVTIQHPPSSSTRSSRSFTSSNVAPNTPQRSRRINKGPPDILGDVDIPDPDTHDPSEISDDVVHAAVTATVRSDVDTQSSPSTDDESITAVEPEEPLTTSPQAEKQHKVHTNQHSLLPITPDEIQNTLVDSQAYLTTAQEHTLPPSPRLTQITSTAHDSFNAGSLVTQEHLTISAAEGEPPHNTITTDVVSVSASEHSVQSASDAELEATKIAKPSIGLSTPIAYYTPLKDLPYFLNRSSAFHSAGSPDILALVTTPSTPPTRASKGPKHHTTTLHITDLSMYPSQTTVQVFRTYANALPVAEPGDVVLLRGMSVKSLNRHACLVSADESAWCVWRYGKPLWGKKRGAYGEMKSREEIKGPAVERGEGEWAEVEKIRGWYVDVVKEELEEKVKRTRSKDKQGEDSRGAMPG